MHRPSTTPPARRVGRTSTVTIGTERLAVTATCDHIGQLREVSIQWGKYGTTTDGLMHIYAQALTTGLQHHIPLIVLLEPGLDLHFAPAGRTDDSDVPQARSIVDYTARRLALDWLPFTERAELDIYTATERAALTHDWTIDDFLQTSTTVTTDELLAELEHDTDLLGWHLATTIGSPLRPTP